MISSKLIFELPFPSTAIVQGPEFRLLKGRDAVIEIVFDNEGVDERLQLIFTRVERYVCSFMNAIDAETINRAYDSVVDIKGSDALRQISDICMGRAQSRGEVAHELHHFMICFDSGPCYEFFCREFKWLGSST